MIHLLYILFSFFINLSSSKACNASIITNSNRNINNPCEGNIGDECSYMCAPGYVKIGRHVCQNYEANGQHFINNTFFGGRCVRICGSKYCAKTQTTLRYNSNDEDGYCLAVKCFESDTALLKNLLRGNYEVWQSAYNQKSGFYLDGVNIIDPNSPSKMAATGIVGLGLISEVLGHALGFQTWDTFKSRVALTLRSLVGLNEGINVPQDDRGFFIHFMNAKTGKANSDTTCLMCTGLLMAGAKFVSTYATDVKPEDSKDLKALVGKLWDSIHFEDLLCDREKNVNSNGTGIPMTLSLKGATCPNGAQYPKADGFYQFNEEHYTIWFAFEKVCESFNEGQCPNKAIENMWRAWQGRRKQPNHNYMGYDLLSMWSGYLVQLPYYTCHSFNADSDYLKLFRNHWEADWYFYNTTQVAGERGRYGLGAGPTPKWCTEGSGYIADRLDPNCQSHCRIYSPYITAGYLPIAKDVILPQLMDLASDGETVFQVPNTDYFVLWRKAMMDYSWPSTGTDARFTMVDFSSELFGLATLFLEEDFFQKYTNHFAHD